MCTRASCSKCGKVTWAGCGAHVDAVMRGVAESDRCLCAVNAKAPQAAAAEPKRRSAGWRF